VSGSPPPEVCFFERNPSHPLARRAGIEGVGTFFLMFAAAGSADVAANLGAPSAAALLMHAIATSGALVGLIIAFGPISGGHFNPIITMGQWLTGDRSSRCTLTYTICQLIGGFAGALAARATFSMPIKPVAASGWPLIASEVVATTGLMLIVYGVSRAKRAESGPFAVGAWLTGMIIYSPSSYANPALALGALAATGPIVITGLSAGAFVLAQIVGGLIAVAVIALGYGPSNERRTVQKALP
jgi:glycerol uptake facilitator-like aquaporin